MVVRNEEEFLSQCLDRVKDIADEIIVVDTGSTDKTVEVASKYTNHIYDFKWRDDFSAARNFSISKAKMEWILWLNADDTLECPELVKQSISNDFEAYYFNIISGDELSSQPRLFRNDLGIYFKGRMYEQPALNELRAKKLGLNILHGTTGYYSEDRLSRNFHTLMEELKEEPGNTRALFYLGKTLMEARRGKNAIEIFQEFIELSLFKEWRFLAHKYIGQILMKQKKYEEAVVAFLSALKEDSRWAESYYYTGECKYFLGQYKDCVHWMQLCAKKPMPDSVLPKEIGIYKDMPYRYLCDCYEKMGDMEKVLKYRQKTVEKFS